VQFDVGIEYAKQAIQLLKTDNNNDKNNLAQIYNRLISIQQLLSVKKLDLLI